MRNLLALAIGTAFLTSCASTSPNTNVVGVSVELPKQLEWSVVSDRSDNTQYIKEWAPKGEDPLTAKWLITEKKLTLGSKISAEQFQKQMFVLSKQSCTDVSFRGPQEIVVKGYKTSVGRIMCAEQVGRPFGTFTEQRVIIDGSTAYVVTSELRIPKSPKAGVLVASKFKPGELKKFVSMQFASAKFVRESVDIKVQ